MIGFSYILVFIDGATSFFAFEASTVVVSISSAIPFESFAIRFAVAGASIIKSALLDMEICLTSNSKLRSNVSIIHLLPVSVSKVSGAINCVAFFVIITWTSAFCFTSKLHKFAILYAAIPPEIPTIIVFPFNILSP